jgi:trimeric autotransporter adhesin
MLTSQLLTFHWKRNRPRTRFALALLLLVGSLVTLPMAAQTPDFIVQAAPFSPIAVDPGGTTASNLTLGSLNGFNGTVDLTCTVSPTPTSGSAPECLVSPPSVTPPAGGAVTITTFGTETNGQPPTTPGLYTTTIIGTATINGTLVTHTATQNVTVLAVTPSFTLSVQTAIAPTSVHAGNGATGVIVVSPLNNYSGTVTLSCSSITPLVTIPPQCSFSYPNGMTGLPVSQVPQTSTITITTIGPTTYGQADRNRPFYALCLPMLGMVGLGAAFGGKRSRRAWSLLAILIIAAAVLLVPACYTTQTFTSTNNNYNGITPKNTYVFTLMGVDADGNTSSNSGSSNTPPTVSLTVN